MLGSLINYTLGRFADAFRDRRWFQANPEALCRVRDWYGRWGRWSLLLSWVPIIGNPLTVAAGLLRESLWSFLLVVTIAKVGRYLVLAAMTLKWL